MEKLNEQQKRFCEYFLLKNKVKAYMAAYPESGYNAASSSASRLLEDARIKERIEYLKQDIESLTGVSKSRNVAELAKIAYSNIADLHDTWIELKKFEEIDDDCRAAIESIDTKTEERHFEDTLIEIKYVKIKLYSKINAIQEINKMMGYNAPTKLDVTDEITVKIQGQED